MKTALRNLGCLSLGLAIGCTVVEEPTFHGDPLATDGESRALGPAGDTPLTNVNEPPPLDAEGCPGLFAQEHLPRFDLTVNPAVMSTLYEDWIHGRERNSLDEDDTPYRPLVEFRYGDIAIGDAMIRLRGNPNFWLEQNKMQFQISFDEIDKNGRFLGVRKLLFDAAALNRHFLRDRLSLWLMRQAGISAPCANNALVYINDEYYGLFTNLEKLDEEFLTRVFPEDDGGDLWKRRNWEIKTNEDSYNRQRLGQLRNASDEADDGEGGNLIQMEPLLDIEQALRVYAVDAVIPNSDGPWAGGLNFYLYDHPGIGKFVLLPWDLDNTFDRLEPNVDPYTYRKDVRYHGRPFYHTIMKDDAWFQRYVEIVEEVLDTVYVHEDLWQLTGNTSRVPLGALNPSDMVNLGAWSLQIREAALADINKPYTNQRMEDRRGDVAEFLRDRELFLRTWVNGWKDCFARGGGRNASGDGCSVP
jgi:CotH kinase protein